LGTQNPLPPSQELTPDPYMSHTNPIHTLISRFLRFILILPSHLCRDFPNLFSPRHFHTRTLHTYTLPPMHSTFPDHLILLDLMNLIISREPIPVAALSKAWVCGRWLAGIVGSNPAECVDVYLLCCVLSGRGRGLCDGLITRPEESYRLWCVVVCDHESCIMRWPWPIEGCYAMVQKNLYLDRSTNRNSTTNAIFKLATSNYMNTQAFRPPTQ